MCGTKLKHGINIAYFLQYFSYWAVIAIWGLVVEDETRLFWIGWFEFTLKKFEFGICWRNFIYLYFRHCSCQTITVHQFLLTNRRSYGFTVLATLSIRRDENISITFTRYVLMVLIWCTKNSSYFSISSLFFSAFSSWPMDMMMTWKQQ